METMWDRIRAELWFGLLCLHTESTVIRGEKGFGMFWVFFPCFSECVSSRSEYFQQGAEEENSTLILLPFKKGFLVPARLTFYFSMGQVSG